MKDIKNISFAYQEEQLGTGHAVMCARELLENADGDTVILPGDMPLIGKDNIQKLMENHSSNNYAMTIFTAIFDNPFSYGRIVRKGNTIVKIVEEKEATDEEIIKAIEIAQIPDVLKHYEDGLDHVVEQGGANFSGGQKQRLCIARAIVKEPKILILDDSTSAVDTKTDKLIRRALKNDLPQMTKIVIAQRISSIEEADQIIVLDNGKINAIGTHEELLKNNDIYKEVYVSQTQKGGN